MSTDVLSLSDTELQAMFDEEKKCDCTKSKGAVTTWRCDAPAEWLLICKTCATHNFSCDPCFREQSQYRERIRLFCRDCGANSKYLSELMRCVGRV